MTVDSVFQEFLAGRRSFSSLIEDLAALAAASPAAPDAIDDAMGDLVNRGRLPRDLAQIITATLAPKPTDRGSDPRSAPEADAASVPEPGDWLDPPTQIRPAAAAVPSPERLRPSDKPVRPLATDSPPLPREPLQAQLDDALLSSLAGDFKAYRTRAGSRATTREGVQDRLIDAALESFRGVRLRRDAERASEGQGRAFDVGSDDRQGRQGPIGVGTILKDRFVLDREIGRGGMGIVYRAVDRRRLEASHHQPYVAVKTLSADLRRGPDVLRALEAEARRAQDLAHPNIVTIFDFDRDGTTLFIVMELLLGEPLDALLKKAGDGGLGYERSRLLVEEICRGLAYAHDRGVIHCDLKPANVFVLESGAVKLLDFGLAIASRGGVYEASQLDGYTLAYASPEILSGAPRHPADDVYALGCLVHVVLTGRHPYGGASAREAQIEGMTLARPRHLPPAAWKTLRRALSFERAARPADAGAFHRDYVAKNRFGWFSR